MDALVVAAASGGLSLVMVVAARMFLPEYRDQRVRRAKHIHDWAPWEYESTIHVYSSLSPGKDEIPIRRKYVQKRTCSTCGLLEHKRDDL